MDLLWIVIGLLAFCMPHLSASAVGVSLAWAGLPYPAELLGAIFILIALVLSGIPAVLRERLSAASLAGAIMLVLFECVCGALPKSVAGDLTISFVGEIIHALAAGLWLFYASLGDSRRPLGAKTPRLACALFAAAGMAWYVALAVTRASRVVWNPQVEVALWIATVVCVVPYLAALWTCNLAPKQFAFLASAPLAGALLSNRIWWLVTLFGMPDLTDMPTAPWLVVAPVLAVGGLAAMWLATKDEAAEEAEGQAEPLPVATGHTSVLPLHRIPGYDSLSEREREVLLLTLEGKSSAQIARDSELAPTTVRTYLVRAYEKLGVTSSQELIDTLRQSIEGEVAPASEDTTEETPQLSPALIIAVPTVTIVLVALVVGLVPTSELRSLVGLVLGLVVLAVGGMRGVSPSGTREPVGETPLMAPTFALMTGAAIALVAASVAFGPMMYLIQRALVALAVVAAALVLTRRAKSFSPATAPLTCVFTGLVIVCLIPRGIRSQLLLHGLAPLPIAAGLLVIAYLLIRRAANDELAAVASAALAGDERTLAYLTGRGLKDLVAQVALLTARDFPLGGIAATLHLSESTVTHYRKRAYDALDVNNKTELIDLLEKEAGLGDR